MTTEELRHDIHQLVDSIQNELTLVDIRAAVALLIEEQNLPLDDESQTPVLAERMSQLAGQIERGEYITNETMKQQVKQWLAK